MIAAAVLLISITTAIRADMACLENPGGIPILKTILMPIMQLPVPIPIVMEPAKKINTCFLLHTRDSTTAHEVKAANVSTVRESSFDPEKKTLFAIHGYLSTGEGWPVTMCQKALTFDDVNCFVVDWRAGADLDYIQALQNTRVVAAAITCFLRQLGEMYNYDASRVYIIGHSLGAHIAGQAGWGYFDKYHKKIQRITGLDPAGPGFGKLNYMRLKPSDAEYVDAIYTDKSSIVINLGTGGFGSRQICGHLNFYPNGGAKQPGCPNIIGAALDLLMNAQTCNHARACELYIESIGDPTAFTAYPAPSYESFQNGAGFPCSNGNCVRMGYHTDSNTQSTEPRFYYFNTGANSTYAMSRHRVTFDLTASDSTEDSTDIVISFYDSSGKKNQYTIYRGRLVPGSYSSFLDIPVSGPLPAVTVTFSKPSAVKISHVTMHSGHDDQIHKFCEYGPQPEDGSHTVGRCE